MAARKKSEEPSINIDEVLTDEELKAVANESEPAEHKAKSEDGPRTVVVAEDEAVNRMDLVAMLEDNGYEVVGQAANGEEAVELTRKYRPDVVCMDVKMPRMDGITAAGIICDENIAPVVMLTAFSQTEAYSQLYMELATDADKAAEFINGVIPNKKPAASAPLPELMDRKKRDIMERKGDKEDENKRQKQQKESSAAAL